jgi:hypothetical protein
MKIAFAGASGTGKSTLARWTAETYNLPFNPVGSRSVAKSMGFVGEDGEGRPYDVDQATAWAYDANLHTGPKEAARTAKDAYARSKAEGRRPGASCTMRPVFQRRLADEKIAWEQAHEDFVTDRTPLDDLVYALMHCREIVDAPFIERAIEHTRDCIVFYCPLRTFQAVGADLARVADATYHVQFDLLLHALLRLPVAPGRRLVTLDVPSIESRQVLLRGCLEAP